MVAVSLPDFQNAFDPARGPGFQPSRAYWLGKCSELVYPVTEEEKEADRKASEARAAEKAVNPPWWKPWNKSVSPAECERARAVAFKAVSKVVRTEALRIEADIKAWGFDRFQFISGVSTQCFVAASDKLIVVCFRGTEPNRVWDIYDDLMAIPMRVPQVAGLIHVGFWTALKQVWRDDDTPPLVWPADQESETCKGFKDYLREFRNKQNPQLVWITGHSLGGALATMAAARLVGEEELDPKDIGGVYTFGQPRVGDQMFSETYELGDRHFRAVHDNDVVTRVPPESLRQAQAVAKLFIDKYPIQQENTLGISGLQYRHVGRVAFLNSTAGIELDISKWELFQRRITARLKAPFKTGSTLERLLPGLTDHSMSNYNKVLAANASTLVLDSKANTTSAQSPDRSMSDQHHSSSSPAKQQALTNGLRSNLLSIFSGAGVGILVGILLGTAVSQTVGLVLGGLASSLALILGLNDRYFTQAKAIRIGTFGFVCVVSTLAGMYIRTHQLLAPSYESQLKRYKELGYEPKEAREILKFTRALVGSPATGDGSGPDLAQRIHAGVLFSAEVELNSCFTFEGLDGLPPSEIVISFALEKGTWREMAVLADGSFDAANTKKFLLAAQKGICGQTAEDVRASSCEKLKSLPEDVEHEKIREAFSSSEGIWNSLVQNIDKSGMNSKDQATALWIAKTALCKKDEGNQS